MKSSEYIYFLCDSPDFCQFSGVFAHYKRLDGGVYFIDMLPMTASGKIARHLVKMIAVEMFNERKNIR